MVDVGETGRTDSDGMSRSIASRNWNGWLTIVLLSNSMEYLWSYMWLVFINHYLITVRSALVLPERRGRGKVTPMAKFHEI